MPRPQRPLRWDEARLRQAAQSRGARIASGSPALRPHRLTPAQQVLGHRQGPVHVFGCAWLHQAAERQIRHRESGALPLTNRHGTPSSLRRTATEKPVVPCARCRSSSTRSGSCSSAAAIAPSASSRGSDDAVARIVLDQIFERFRKLTIVLDDQDPEHPRASPK